MTQVATGLAVVALLGAGNSPAQTISGERALMNRIGPGPGISAVVAGSATERTSIDPSRALLGRSSRPEPSAVSLNPKAGDPEIAVSPERALLARVQN